MDRPYGWACDMEIIRGNALKLMRNIVRIEPFEEVAMYEEVGNIDESAIYRDITEAGGLGPAIQAQLTAIGSSLSMTKADPDTAGLFPFNWEAVRGNDRSSQI